MRIIGYCWASRGDLDQPADPDEGTRKIRDFLQRKRWDGPIQLEDASEALVDFHLRSSGKVVADMLRAGDILIVPDQSYLFSTPSQGLTFLRRMRQRRVCVHSINLSGDIVHGKLFDLIISILLPLARAEPRIFQDRARATKRRERQKGSYLGGTPPIGFVVDANGKLQDDGTRKRIVRQILRLKAKGMSLREIASEMREKGFVISHTGVSTLLKSAGYSSATARSKSNLQKSDSSTEHENDFL